MGVDSKGEQEEPCGAEKAFTEKGEGEREREREKERERKRERETYQQTIIRIFASIDIEKQTDRQLDRRGSEPDATSL